MSVTGYVQMGDGDLIPDFNVTETWHMVDNFTWNRGRHTFKAGFDYRHMRLDRAGSNNARGIYQELGMAMPILDTATGGGTDAAFAGLRPKGGVLESFGLRGFGSHSNDDEYILVSNIAPRLYLATKMVLDVGSGRVRW